MEEYMTEKVQFVVTSEGWHDSFEDVRYAVFLFFAPAGICGHMFQREGPKVARVAAFFNYSFPKIKAIISKIFLQ